MKALRMKSIVVLMAAFFTLTSIGTVFGAEWEKSAESYFEDDYYEECIKVVREHKDNNFARMFLAFSHLQEYGFNNTKSDKEKFKNTMMILKDKTGSEDIYSLLYFVNQKDKPTVVKEARKLLKSALKNCTRNEDVQRLIPLLNSSDEETKSMTITTIKKIIVLKRKVVNKGGTLRKKDITMMSDPALIRALFANIVKSSPTSRTLVLIEKPVLEYISEYDGKKVMQLETKIIKAIGKRKKKFSESNWYSATGKIK